MSQQSDTPETDAQDFFFIEGSLGHTETGVDVDFARKLERQRDDARKKTADAIREKGARIEDLKRDLQSLKDDMSLRLSELEEVEKHRDAAREDARRLAALVEQWREELEESCGGRSRIEKLEITEALAAHEAMTAKA